MSKLALCLFLVFSFHLVQGQDCDGVMIGELPTLEHDVSGTLFVEDEFTFCIQDFSYDGNGPDAFLYFYYPGDSIDATGGGVIIPLSEEREGQFEVGRVYDNEVLRFTLPEFQFRGCDFEAFAIWCRYANQLFTSITWNTAEIFTTSLSPVPGMIQCTQSPGRGYIGELPTLAHNVGGQIYVRDTKTFVIRNFTYDGQGPGLFVYTYNVGVEVDPTGGGDIIPLTENNGPEGSFGNMEYTGLPMPDFIITIPQDMDLFTCDVGTFTIWCRNVSVFFSRIDVDNELFTNNLLESAYEPNRILCDRPATRPGYMVEELPSTDERAISGTFYVQDASTFFIQLFSFDAMRDNVFIYYFPSGTTPTSNGDGGFRISISENQEGFLTGTMNSFFNQDFTIDVGLAEGDSIQTCDVGTISIIDTTTDEGEVLTTIDIPTSAFVTDCEGMELENGGPICCGALQAFSTLGLLGAVTISLLALLFKA